MNAIASTALRPDPGVRRPLIPDSVAGTVMFVFTEVMLFAGFISAHVVFVSNQTEGLWPPPNQPLLPFSDTLRNSGLLIASGITLAPVWWALKDGNRSAATVLLGFTALLGAGFVSLQGVEWTELLREGLTLTSSPYGAFFYMIVGAHALHAVGGLGALLWGWNRARTGQLTGAHLASVSLFWYFVVLVWPVIFFQVYR